MRTLKLRASCKGRLCRKVPWRYCGEPSSVRSRLPPEALQQVLAAFEASGLNHRSALFEADHTFMRDDGPRWDPQAADQAWSAAMQFLADQPSGNSKLVSSSASTS